MAEYLVTYKIASLYGLQPGQEVDPTQTEWTKVYDGESIESNKIIWVGIQDGDSPFYFLAEPTFQLHVGTLSPTMADEFPKVLRVIEGKITDVTDEYEFTQIETTFTVTQRDVTLQSATLTKEYDGTALVGGGDVTDITAGLTDKGYVSGEEFAYSFTGSQLFVGESDNTFSVSDSSTALTGDYNSTLQYGKLIVTGRTAPLTITVKDQTRTYDGTAEIDTQAYTVTGDLAYGDTITVTLSNSNINAGTYKDGITATYRIMHGDVDVTDMYLNVTVDNGDLTINKKDVTITSASGTKAYDGTALTNSNTSVTSGSFVAGEGYVAKVTGSQTEVGSSLNYFTISAAAGTNMNNYNVTKVEGTLTVTGYGDLTITAGDASKMYDGTALTCSDFTYTGLEAGHTITVSTAGSVTHFGTTANTITSCTVLDANGNDVTSAYNSITTVDGTLSITKRDATLTSGSATKKYDGIPLTEESVTVTGSGFISGEGATYYNFASRTAVGSTDNTFSYVLNNGTFADDYAITTANGTLTVTENDTLITITADSDSKMYDGSALTDSGYTVTGNLAAGDYFASVTITGSITDAGTAANKVTGYTILNQAGDDVTSFYSNIQTVDGKLEVTKRSVTLTSASDSWMYDGKAHQNTNVSVTGDGWAAGEGATYTVTGSQTVVGTSTNTFSYTLNDGTKAGNYDIATVEGTLEITKRDCTITIGAALQTGLSFLYDNTSTKVLTDGQYIVSGLAEGESLANVTITTNSANAGIYDEDAYTVTYDIVNAAGVSTKSNYDVTLNMNDVEITKRTITIAADSASKVYDGTALTCHTYTVEEGATAETQLLDGEEVEGVGFTADSTITHVGSTANKVDASNVTITKADGSDSSMNYNIETEDGTLTVTARGVLLQSTSADKYYDGTALQNRQVIVTGFHYDSNGNVIVDENAGFLKGDGCTYDFVNDNIVIDKDGNIIAWTVSEQSDTAYGQTEVGTSKNEFNYNNFTSVYFGSYESDYNIIYGGNQESLGLSKDTWDLFGDLTVWGGPVEINMTDYSWTYDYQAKTNGYFDDGYTVRVSANEAGTEVTSTEVAHNSEGSAIALLGSDTIVVTVTGEGGSIDTGKVQHVDDNKQNTATYTIYRNGEDVTDEVGKYYQISIDGGLLKITPRTVELTSGSATKVYDGTALTDNTVIEGSYGRDKGFIFGEGAAYEVTGSRTEIGTSNNTFAIAKLLTDTRAADYNFVMTEGVLTVKTNTVAVTKSDVDGNAVSDVMFQYTGGDHQIGFWMNGTSTWQGTGTAQPADWELLGNCDMNSDGMADQVMLGKVQGGAYVGYYDAGDTTAGGWVNIGYLNNEAGYNWKNAIGNLTGNENANSIVWHSTDLGVLGAWTDGTDSWTSLGSGFDADWTLTGTGDFDGDGVASVLMSYKNGEKYYTVNLDGNAAELANSDEGWKVCAIGDFSGDGADDIVAFHAETGIVAKWENGDSTRWTQLGQLDASDWFVVGAGDYDGNGQDDLLVRQYSTGMLGYYSAGNMSLWNEMGRGVDMNWTVVA